MLSTGREYDRFVIAIVIITLIALAFYVVRCNQNQTKLMHKKQTEFTQRLDYLSGQVKETEKTMQDLVHKPASSEPASPSCAAEPTAPSPVTSSFQGCRRL